MEVNPLPAHRGEVTCKGFPTARMPKLRCYFQERYQHEGPLSETRMRNDQIMTCYDIVTVQQDVYIKGSRPFEPFLGSIPAKGRFYCLEALE